MITDPQRMRKSDPGNPDICNVFEFHNLYSDSDTVSIVEKECRTAKIGCVDCKKRMAENLIAALEPIQEKRRYYENNQNLVNDVIAKGSEKASIVAKNTMSAVRSAIKI
jgi:tryptophanyl-tRNA synthetase